MSRTALLLILTSSLAACGGDAPPAQAPASTTAAAPASAPPAAESAPAPAMDAMDSAAMADDDAVSYDPIDVSKLDNAWWRQYSAGG
ncbi:MAG: hypothetical protein KDK06_09855 [Gammaproteobacteria bacterium]|nr:hypothetical protein [Gammaproteobacteria bacterium]